LHQVIKLDVNDKVITQNMDGKYNNVSGTVKVIYPNIDTEIVYLVSYDVPFGSCTEGMFKESDLKAVGDM
jgi:hypothetical protein